MSQAADKPRRFMVVVLAVVLAAAMAAVAVAQSTGSGISLNSPVSFPVDI